VRASKIETRFYEDANGINQPYKILVRDEVKAAQFEAAQLAKEEELASLEVEKRSACKSLKTIDADINDIDAPAQGNTIAALKGEINSRQAKIAKMMRLLNKCIK
jgi:hypothetical protein